MKVARREAVELQIIKTEEALSWDSRQPSLGFSPLLYLHLQELEDFQVFGWLGGSLSKLQ